MQTSVRKIHDSFTYLKDQFFHRKKQSVLVTSLERWNYVAFQLLHSLLFQSLLNNVVRKNFFIRERIMKFYADFSKENSWFFHVSYVKESWNFIQTSVRKFHDSFTYENFSWFFPAKLFLIPRSRSKVSAAYLSSSHAHMWFYVAISLIKFM